MRHYNKENRFSLKANLGLLLACTCLVSPAWAQTIPNNVSPGAIIQSQEMRLPTNATQGLRPATEKPETQLENIPETPPPADSEVDAKKVLIQRIEIQGMTLLPFRAVRDLLDSYENRELSFPQIQELSEQLTRLYYDEGYVTSSVYVPPQKIAKDGHLLLKAFEGKIGETSIKSGKHFKPRYMAHRLRLKSGDYLNIKTIQKNLNQINQSSDAFVAGSLKRGEKNGTTDIDFSISDQRPIHFSPSFSNMGRRLIGDRQVGATFINNNLLGFGDQFVTNASFTYHTQGLVNHYEIPVGSHGTVIGFDRSWGHLTLGREFSALNIKGGSTQYSPFILQPWVNKENLMISTDFAVDFKEQYTDQQGLDLNKSQLFILRPGFNLQHFGKTGSTSLREEIGIGLNAFNSGISILSGIPQDKTTGSFFRLTSTITRYQKLPWNTVGIFRLNGQYSPDDLLSTEQFQVGGAYTIRGYREGTQIGNSGYLLSAEWYVPMFFIPKHWTLPRVKESIRDSFKLVGFVDYGATYLKSSADNANEQLFGAGLGLRAKLSKFLTLRLDIGVPIFRDKPFSQRPRLHFGIDAPIF